MDKKIVSRTVGFISAPLGLFLGFIYFTNIEELSGFFLVLSLILSFCGLLILGNDLNTILSTKTGIDTSSPSTLKPSPADPYSNVVEKNNKLLKEWTRTARSREQLKLLKAAASVNEM